MNHGTTATTEHLGSDDDILVANFSDTDLETAAGAPAALAAMSFPNAPTVSILVMCCSNDSVQA